MNKLITGLALLSAAWALPRSNYFSCEKAYDACIADGTPEVTCSCSLSTCLGQDTASVRKYCSTATASLAQASKTAHPSPSMSKKTKETSTPIPGAPPPYHTGLPPTHMPIPIVPGGCSPAKPELCASSHVISPSSSVTASHPIATPTNGSKFQNTTYPSVKPVNGKTWAIKNLTRYCDGDNDECDYKLAVKADGKIHRCTITRTPGSDAATESWAEQCIKGSGVTISWGYVTKPAPAFAVITVVKGKELAWFGVPDVNGQKVTPSHPFGSGKFGDLGQHQVYTY